MSDPEAAKAAIQKALGELRKQREIIAERIVKLALELADKAAQSLREVGK